MSGVLKMSQNSHHPVERDDAKESLREVVQALLLTAKIGPRIDPVDAKPTEDKKTFDGMNADDSEQR
jgi:hypothetical protein